MQKNPQIESINKIPMEKYVGGLFNDFDLFALPLPSNLFSRNSRLKSFSKFQFVNFKVPHMAIIEGSR